MIVSALGAGHRPRQIKATANRSKTVKGQEVAISPFFVFTSQMGTVGETWAAIIKAISRAMGGTGMPIENFIGYGLYFFPFRLVILEKIAYNKIVSLVGAKK